LIKRIAQRWREDRAARRDTNRLVNESRDLHFERTKGQLVTAVSSGVAEVVFGGIVWGTMYGVAKLAHADTSLFPPFASLYVAKVGGSLLQEVRQSGQVNVLQAALQDRWLNRQVSADSRRYLDRVDSHND
jgi:hypothetical protein